MCSASGFTVIMVQCFKLILEPMCAVQHVEQPAFHEHQRDILSGRLDKTDQSISPVVRKHSFELCKLFCEPSAERVRPFSSSSISGCRKFCYRVSESGRRIQRSTAGAYNVIVQVVELRVEHLGKFDW